MEHWRTPYLGLREIPPGLDDFELTTFFSYSADELLCIGARHTPLYKLAVALQIGFIRMSGRTLDAFKHIPKRLWSHIAGQIGVEEVPEIATLRSLYAERPRTLADHQELAYKELGFHQMTEHQRRYVVRWLRETLTGRASASGLLPELKRWFYDHRILLIADRELKRFIIRATRDQEAQLLDALTKAYGAERLAEWGRALAGSRDDGTPLQTWLWAPPLKQSAPQMSQFFEKIKVLREMGVHQGWPEGVNEAAVRHYGRRCANRPPAASKRIAAGRRSLEVACFLRHALCSASDQLLLMLRRWVQHMASKAGKQTAPKYVDAQTRLREFAQAVRELAGDDELSREELAAQLCALADAALLDAQVSRAALARGWLIEHPRQARSILVKLLGLPLASDGEHPVMAALEVLRGRYAAKSQLLPPVPQIDLGRRWREAIGDEDRRKAMNAFEWATLFKLRMALRNGSIHLDHSFAFRGHAALLIPLEEWAAQRNHHYGHLKLPQDAKAYLALLKEQLEQRLGQLADAVKAGRLRIDEHGIQLERQAVRPEELRVSELRRALYAAHGPGQIPEMMLQIDSQLRFSWLLLGREPYNRSELLLVYAAVLNLGTAMTATEVAHMVPGLSADALRQMTKRLCDDRKLRAAADAVFEYLQRFDIAEHWGRGDLASADMMSLQTPRAIWQARADPRRRTASLGIYTHAHDCWGFFYDQPIVLNRRQAGVAIEGMVRQQAVEDLGLLAVDTHGFTYFAMMVSKLLGFDLCPRLADLKSRRLHVPVDSEVPDALKAIVECDLDEAKIEAAFDELVRIASSIRIGRCSAVQALERYGSAARGQPAYDAGVQLGKMLTAVYLMDYFLKPDFRAEIQHALNRGEAMHTLQRAIHDGQVPNDLAKRDESMAGVSSALSLLSNIVMAWNTERLQPALDRLRAAGGAPSAEDLRRIAPTRIEGINFRGTFDFPVEKYAARILPSYTAASASTGRRSA